jgi:hypothetical protein
MLTGVDRTTVVLVRFGSSMFTTVQRWNLSRTANTDFQCLLYHLIYQVVSDKSDSQTAFNRANPTK